ncbi:hypothetical protein M569_16533 [Genlisea aurea]|uniref:MACPF domain-containing protein n=1 Tax=Genlisea aurea TaxID=192259 RepID=S8DFX5_9LAMI|nr:hypothetical protein M569_16533 [Genlisea aurea]
MAGDGDGGGGDGIVHKSISCLGRGFDFTSDFKLDFLKAEKLIRLNETDTRQIHVPGFGSFRGISVDVKCDKGDRTRYRSDILDFNQMSELFNRRSSVTGKIPSGTFNATFGFGSCSWGEEAARTKSLGMDGYFIELFKLHIDRYPLKLADEVRDEVPSTWDPPALAR